MSKELVEYLEKRCVELLLENDKLKKEKQIKNIYNIELEQKDNDLLIYCLSYYIGTYRMDSNYIQFADKDEWKITPEELLEIVLMIEDKKDEI